MKHESDRKTAAQFEILARDAEVPKAMRDLAERNIAQMRETYERSKDALENAMQSWERHFFPKSSTRTGEAPHRGP